MMNAKTEDEIREYKGSVKAYHKILEFLIYDKAREGKDVIENAD